MKYRIMDLFSGIGGLSYGFSKNDTCEIVLANEIDSDTAKGFCLNHPSVKMLNCNIKEVNDENLKEFLVKKIDLIIGGPPCQSYSTLGKRCMDERAQLFREYRRILSIVKPTAFIFENVTGILSMDNGNLIKQVQNEFVQLGYEIKCEILNAADFGVPQYRERVFIVGKLGKNNFSFPKPTHGENLKPYVTVEDALSDMPMLSSGESASQYLTKPVNDFQKFVHDCSLLTDNSAPNNGEHLVKIMKALPDGGSKYDLPIELRPKSGYCNTYAKMWWKKPAPTITRNFATPSSSRCIHPRDSRAMTVREGARLQSFPDSYKFYGGTGKKHLQIGNAVPPLLSIALAQELIKVLGHKNDNE